MTVESLPPEWWKDRDMFLRVVGEYESNAAVAAATGIGESTIRKWRKRHGLDASTHRGAAEPSLGSHPGEDVEVEVDHIDDLESLLAERGLDLADWIIVRVVVNKWEGFYKTSDDDAVKVPQRQLKVTLRPKVRVELLLPVELAPFPAVKRIARKPSRPSRLVFVYGDDQRPNVDRGFEETKLDWIRENQPDVIVDLGDGMDMPTISGHKPDPAHSFSVQECANDYATWLYRVRCAAPDAEVVVLADNHVQRRLRDYQLERAAALYGVRPAEIPGLEDDLEPLLSLRRLLRLDELGVRYVAPPGDTHYAESQYEIVPGRLVALHGYRTGANVGKKLLDDYGCSVVYGHVHGQDVYVTDWRRRGVGVRERLYALGVGCGAIVHGGIGFAPGADWQNSAMTVSMFPSGGWSFDYLNFEHGVLRWRDQEYAADVNEAAA